MLLAVRPNCSQAEGCAYRRSLDNGDSLNNLLLVQLRTGAVEIADDGRHTGLVAHGGRQVDGLLGVILREAGGCVSVLFELLAVQAGVAVYLFTLPLCLAARFRGKNASDP